MRLLRTAKRKGRVTWEAALRTSDSGGGRRNQATMVWGRRCVARLPNLALSGYRTRGRRCCHVTNRKRALFNPPTNRIRLRLHTAMTETAASVSGPARWTPTLSGYYARCVWLFQPHAFAVRQITGTIPVRRPPSVPGRHDCDSSAAPAWVRLSICWSDQPRVCLSESAISDSAFGVARMNESGD